MKVMVSKPLLVRLAPYRLNIFAPTKQGRQDMSPFTLKTPDRLTMIILIIAALLTG
jgi:hypothetical protein